jgi:hypothetical protein
MKLKVLESRLEESNRARDILHRIATDKVRIVFLKRQLIQNGDWDITNERKAKE